MEAKAAPKPKPPLTEEIEEATSVQEEVCMLVTALQWFAKTTTEVLYVYNP